MRLGLGLNFLHRQITIAVADAIVVVGDFVLQQNGDFLLQDKPLGNLTTEDGDIINFGGIQVLQTENSNNLFRQVGGFILTEFFDEGDNALLEQSADGDKIILDQA